MSYLGCIIYIMAGSCLKQLLSQYYAQNTDGKMLTGHVFARVVRGHTLVRLAFGKMVKKISYSRKLKKNTFHSLLMILKITLS